MSQMNLSTEHSIENRLVVTKREESREGKDWEYGISRCKLLSQYIGWTNNKVLLYSTGKYIHRLLLRLMQADIRCGLALTVWTLDQQHHLGAC